MTTPADEAGARHFVRSSPPPETFTYLAMVLRTQFGLDLTPEQAAHLWRSVRQPKPGPAPAFERDEPLMSFIADRADLVTINQLLALVRQTFGLARAPSRSQLHRLIQRVRDKARHGFEAKGRAKP